MSSHRQNLPCSRAIWLLVVLVSLLSADWGSDAALAKDKSEEQPALIRRSAPVKDSDLSTKYARVDPQEDGWTTEVFSVRATRQLKQLAKRMSQLGDIDDVHVADLVSSDFQCPPLRPERLSVVFSDACFQVSRFKREPTTERHSPSLDLANALAGLVQPLAGSRTMRVTFKIIGIQRNDGVPVATVLYQAFGRHEKGSVQQSGRWSCHWHESPDAEPLLARIEVLEFEEVVSSQHDSTSFVDCTKAVLGGNSSFARQLTYGVDHWRQRLDKMLGIHVTGHHGLAIGDVNGDGLDDLYLCQPGGLPNRLFVQQPDGTATDVSASYGVDFLESTFCSLILDLDNDGDQDLALAMTFGVFFVENDGKGKFRLASHHMLDGSRSGGLSQPGALAAADFDNDADLDLFISRYSTDEDLYNMQEAVPLPYHDANNGAPNSLLRNDGAFRFTEVTKEVGLDSNNRRFTFAASWEDYDNDGDQDLYVANDFGRNNLYENREGRFIDVAPDAGVEDIAAGMSVSWGDYNNDGWMDVYISNMFSSAGNRIAYQRQFMPRLSSSTLGFYQRHARGNTLFANNGDGSFTDVSVAAGVTMGRWAWSSNFFDMNNDGLLDILVANGYITQRDTEDL